MHHRKKHTIERALSPPKNRQKFVKKKILFAWMMQVWANITAIGMVMWISKDFRSLAPGDRSNR